VILGLSIWPSYRLIPLHAATSLRPRQSEIDITEISSGRSRKTTGILSSSCKAYEGRSIRCITPTSEKRCIMPKPLREQGGKSQYTGRGKDRCWCDNVQRSLYRYLGPEEFYRRRYEWLERNHKDTCADRLFLYLRDKRPEARQWEWFKRRLEIADAWAKVQGILARMPEDPPSQPERWNPFL